MSRTRRANVAGGRPGRHNVKTSPEEEAVIGLAAAEQNVSPVRFMVEAAMAMARADDTMGMPETPSARRQRMAELFALRHTLADVALQARRVGVNVNQIARAANQGQPVPVEEMRGYLVDEREFLDRARETVEAIDVRIDELSAQGVDV